MPVDLSASIYTEFLKARRRGEQLEDQDKKAAAAGAYRHAAGLMEKYAEYTHDSTVRASRLKKAKFYHHLADRLGGVERQAETVSESTGKTGKQKTDREKDADQYRTEIMALVEKPKVGWADIGGLADTKRLIKSAYGLALAKKPIGLKLDPGSSMLLYGPPGTGKTLLAAATAGGLEATFFNVKVSNLLSKYFGESTKLISALYEVARESAPSVVFLDEFEALVPARGSGESGAERRIVSTLLAELDGLAGKDDDRFLLTMAATNLPWLLDSAILSRFQRKIYIPLPDEDARKAILNIHTLNKGHQTQVPLSDLVQALSGYSGREIEQICEIAAANMVSRANPDLLKYVEAGLDDIQAYQIKTEPLSQEDFDLGMEAIQPATKESVLRNYDLWTGNQA